MQDMHRNPRAVRMWLREIRRGISRRFQAEVHHEEEVEGAVGGQELEDKDDEEEDKQEDEEEDKEDEEDDVIEELVAAGHIKMVSQWARG